MWLRFRSARPPIRTLIAITAVAALAATAAPHPAAASPSDTSPAAYLAAHPGGTIINNTEISYQGGAFIVTLTRDRRSLATADCPTGWFCFYDGINFGYPRGRLSDCGFQDLGNWGWRNRTESVHFKASTGSASFINEAGATDTTLFTASTTRRTLASVTPHGNKADYVYRYC